MTQKAEKCLKLWKSLKKSFTDFDPSYHMIYFTWLEYFASIFPEICFYLPLKTWFEILTNSREGGTFSSLALPVIIYQAYLFFRKLNVQSSTFLIWWGNFESDPRVWKENQNVCALIFSVFLPKVLKL